MGFWKFGRDPSTVDRVSRIVTAKLADGAVMRGKLVLLFDAQHPSPVVDVVGDWAASYAETVLADVDSADVDVCDVRVAAALRRAMPRRFPAVRSISLAAVHLLADRGARARTSPTPAVGGAPRAPTPPEGAAPRAPTPPEGARAPTPREGAAPRAPTPPDGAGDLDARSPTPPGRAGVATPPGPPPFPNRSGTRPAVGAPGSLARAASHGAERGALPDAAIPALAATSRDAAARLTLGALRAHAAIARGRAPSVALAWIAPLVPGPSGGAPREAWGAELARWRSVLGVDAVAAVQREAAVACTYLLYEALLDVGVAGKAAARGVELACRAAFPAVDVPAQLGRYVFAAEVGVDVELARAMSALLPAADATGLRVTLRPLVRGLRALSAGSASAVCAAAG